MHKFHFSTWTTEIDQLCNYILFLKMHQWIFAVHLLNKWDQKTDVLYRYMHSWRQWCVSPLECCVNRNAFFSQRNTSSCMSTCRWEETAQQFKLFKLEHFKRISPLLLQLLIIKISLWEKLLSFGCNGLIYDSISNPTPLCLSLDLFWTE